MRRFYWLLVLPYLVVCKNDYCSIRKDGLEVMSLMDKVYAQDFAAALNEAHMKRSEAVNQDEMDSNPGKQIKRPPQKEEFDYKGACGQSDCGKDPQ